MKASARKGDKAGAQPNAMPAKARVSNKVRFVAKHHGIKIDAAWGRFVEPAIDAEFDRCVAASTAKPGA